MPSRFDDARELFAIPREVAYFNAAYMTPLPLAALRAGEAGVRRKASPWRVRADDFFAESEEARRLFATVLEGDVDGVAIAPSVSYALAVAARNLAPPSGSRIVTLAEQFPSNVYGWRRLARERGAAVVAVDGDDLSAAVLAAIDERTAIVAVPECRWTDGRALDLVAVGARCREVGAALVLDLTQSLGASPFRVADVRPDFVACAGYKWLLGPYSLGWLYAAPERRGGIPLEENWIARARSEDFTRLIDYEESYAAGARRYDVGERSNFALLPIAIASMRLLLEWGVPELQERLAQLCEAVCARVQPLGIDALPAHLRARHYLTLSLPPSAPRDLTARLAARGVHVSTRGERMRVTPHLYNDDEDVERLAAALRAELAR